MKRILLVLVSVTVISGASAKVCKWDVSNCTSFDIHTPNRVTSGDDNGIAWGVTKNGDDKCTVTGISTCSSTSGTYPSASKPIPGDYPSAINGSNCWCKMITPRVGAWVFLYTFGSSAPSCATYCAHYCANFVWDYSDFRAAVLALP